MKIRNKREEEGENRRGYTYTVTLWYTSVALQSLRNENICYMISSIARFSANGWPNLDVFQPKIICILGEIISQNFCSLGSVVSTELWIKQIHTLTYCCFRGLIKDEKFISAKDIYLDLHCSLQQSLFFFIFIFHSIDHDITNHYSANMRKKILGALPPDPLSILPVYIK